MFGNCPRAVWERWAPADEAHRIELACRCLLVKDGGRTILFETGIGAFFEPKLRDRFGVQEDRHVLLENLAAAGVQPADVDIVVLSHLHFDHAGGMLSVWEEGAEPQLVFPNAKFIVSSGGWERAQHPHFRDRASFIPALTKLLKDSGRLEVVAGDRSETLGDAYKFHYSHGHTPGLMLTEIDTPRGPVVFLGDLVPGTPWVHLPITMGYDRFPELIIDEKQALLGDLAQRGGWAFFTHDPNVAAAKIHVDEKGRYKAVESLAALDWD